MYELTNGDLRLIDESTKPWEMTINPILINMEELPEEVDNLIQSLSDRYKAELKDFYLKAMDEDDTRLAAPIFREFDEKWDKEHPEFYDPDRLFEKASAADKERAKNAIEAAKKIFGMDSDSINS